MKTILGMKPLPAIALLIIGFVVPGSILVRSIALSVRKNSVAVINGEPIGTMELAVAASEVEGFDHQNPDHLDNLMRRVVENRYLANEAIKRGLDKSDSEAKRLLEHEMHFTENLFLSTTLMDGASQDRYIPDAEFRRYVEDHKDILYNSDDVAYLMRRVKTKAEADETLKKLQSGATLAELARTSEPSTQQFQTFAEHRYLTPADLGNAELRKAVWTTEVGKFVGPIEIDGSYYFAQPVARRPGRERTFDDIHGKLYSILSRERYDKELDKRKKALAERFPAKLEDAVIAKAVAGEKLPPETVVAHVAGTEITLGFVNSYQENTRKVENRPIPFNEALEKRIEGRRTLVLSKEKKILERPEAADDYSAWRLLALKNAMDRELDRLAQPKDSDVQEIMKRIRDEYAAHPVQLRIELLVVRTEEKAAGVVKRLQAGASMTDLAGYTIVMSRKTDVGWFWPWEIEPELAKALLAARDNEVVGPVKTDLGFMVARVLARKEVPLPDKDLQAIVTASAKVRAAAAAKKEIRDQAWASSKVDVDWNLLARFWKNSLHFSSPSTTVEISGRSNASGTGDGHGHGADDGHGHGADDGHGHGADDGHGHGAGGAK